MTDIEGFLTIYGHSDNLLNNKSLYTKRNKAVKSRDNGRVWLGIYHYIPSETRPLSNGITAAFGPGIYHYIPSETRPLSNGISAAFGSVYITTYRAKQGRYVMGSRPRLAR